jgi:hypothetical protein
LHRRTHLSFKKKNYRLLNSDKLSFEVIAMIAARNNKNKQLSNNTEEGQLLDENKDFNTECAKLLTGSWAPMKRLKLSHET